jgi:hypothetical protein
MSPTEPTQLNPPVVPARDNPSTIKEPSNDKQNNKLSDKRIEVNSGLEEAAKASPDLPEHIRASIKTLVQAAAEPLVT